MRFKVSTVKASEVPGQFTVNGELRAFCIVSVDTTGERVNAIVTSSDLPVALEGQAAVSQAVAEAVAAYAGRGDEVLRLEGVSIHLKAKRPPSKPPGETDQT